ncbi:FG-GAP-like repeat-containing protein [Streptomyces sp. NBC_01022]|uniref:FG-GAP-like repeat-containing protein n=1 Tax=Streptomyces sp. NBC_01022 TaxID=2903723 RepID=UPI002DD933A0|nr:FG-GAP-like repeat-containing protein [Streptomyces sp. NBC_01022]
MPASPSPATSAPVLGFLAAAVAGLLALPLLATTASAASVSTWDKVAQCESSGNWTVVSNSSPAYYGGLQISLHNWQYYGGTAYAAYPHQATKKEQILIAEKILADQGAGAWSCSPGTGLSTDHADPYPTPDPAPPSPADPGMTNLVAGDFNGNGKKDLVAVEVSSGKLWLYPGTGTGTLTSRVVIGTGGWNDMANLAVGDLNKDGKDDVVATEKETGKLFLYKGTGSGLASRVEVGTGGWNGMKNVLAGDFNADGKDDVVASEIETGKLFLYKGTGTGALTSRVEIGTGGWNGMSKAVSPGDMNKDGKDDVIAAEKSTGKLFLYKGTGSGLAERVEIGTGGWNGISDYAGGDFTGDGVGDLAAVESQTGETGKLYLYKGTGTGGLKARTQIGTGGW